MRLSAETASEPAERTGVWIVGARGGVAVTAMVGALATARGRARAHGLVSAHAEFEALGLVPLERLVFGGHEVRAGTLIAAARETAQDNGTIPVAWIDELAPELAAIEAEIRPGVVTRSGEAVEAWADTRARERSALPLARQVELLREDLASFRARHGLARVVMVQLASTEPPLADDPAAHDPAALARALADDRRDAVRASTLYGYAALLEGCALVNFTPSPAALTPALARLAEERGLPYCGSDGKTGETLVKSALAPLFHHRALRVLAWQGYNMLGDRDGEVLAHEDHKRSKVESKDAVVGRILGYPVHTKVAIDYVPSLKDLKTALDFIHFEGFLGFKMSLSFTWAGCDSILAAPLVLDLARFSDLALRRGERGPLRHLASFFKNPVGVDAHDFHEQWRLLQDYAAGGAAGGVQDDGSRAI